MIDMVNSEEQESHKLQKAICDIQDILGKLAWILMPPALCFESIGKFRSMTYTALSLADKTLSSIRQSIDRKLNAR